MGLELVPSRLCGKHYADGASSSTRLIIFKLTAKAEETILWYILTDFYSQKLCRGPPTNLQNFISLLMAESKIWTQILILAYFETNFTFAL